jgi:UDP-GlcNAc:undecaprenyl-phosphate GlcNAc-1-phosphate transferase
MLDNFTAIFSTSVLVMIVSFLVSLIILKVICSATPNFLNFLYISSGKSSTNARLLGGLSISGSIIVAITTLLIFFPGTLAHAEKKTFITALVSIFFVTLYGYIDDKFEVRVRIKLSLQFTSILSFAFFNAPNISSQHPTLAFVFSTIIGLALVNGTNLLDGLDTLTIKLGMTSSLAFLFLGVVANSPPTIYLSVVLISSLAIFYFFNREPAKVYMGEIGGGVIGLIYYIQTSICFSQLKTQMSMQSAIAMVLIAGCFPVCELGISFIRRIYYKKSPFRGDKLHLHYIIKNKYKLSASGTSSLMGIAGTFLLSFGFIVAKLYNPLIALSLVIGITVQTYLWVCLDEWRSNLAKENTQNIFKLFEGRTINIINSTKMGTLEISFEQENTADKKKSA